MGSEFLYFVAGVGVSALLYGGFVVFRKFSSKNSSVLAQLEDIKKSVNELQNHPTEEKNLQRADQKLDETKDEFISFVSHELRAPMGAVKGLVSMMLTGDYGPTPDRFRQPL